MDEYITADDNPWLSSLEDYRDNDYLLIRILRKQKDFNDIPSFITKELSKYKKAIIYQDIYFEGRIVIFDNDIPIFIKDLWKRIGKQNYCIIDFKEKKLSWYEG